MNINCRQPDHTSIVGFDSTRRYRYGTPNPQLSCRLNPGRPLPGYATYPLCESVSLDPRPCPRPPASARGESCASVGCDWGASTGCGIITARSESPLEGGSL